MKHLPALKAAIVASAGILIGRLCPGHALVFLCGASTFLAIAASSLIRKRRRVSGFTIAATYLALSLAFACLMATSMSSVNEVRPGSYRVFEGTVNEIPRDSTRISLILRDCCGYDSTWHTIGGELVLTPKSLIPLRVGDRIMFRGRAGNVSMARNPGQFNMKSYYELNGIAGRVYLLNEKDIIYSARPRGFVFQRDFIEPIRLFIRRETGLFMSGEEAALARAMVLGERAGISRETNERFINTGTIHILAVSGLHIAFLTGILMVLATLFRIPRRYRFFAIAPILVVYGYVVGMEPSVARAVIMAIVVLFSLFLQRRTKVLNSLGFSALVILTYSPAELFSAGFQLSFAAVLSIAYFYEWIAARLKRSFPGLSDRPVLNYFVLAAALTLSATLGTIPLTAFYFGRVSILGILANLLIVPLSSVFMAFNFTFLFFGLVSTAMASAYAECAQLAGTLLLKINELIGSVSFSSVSVGDYSLVFGLLYFLWLALVIWFGGDSLSKKTVFAALLGVDLLIFSGIFIRQTQARLYVLDVGQGDAVYAELPNGKNMLVDAGSGFGTYDAGSRVIVPFLRRMGVKRLDYFLITHLHSDHIGGALAVIKGVKVGTFLYPDQSSRASAWIRTLKAVESLGIRSVLLHAGAILDSGRVHRLYVLHPNSRYTGSSGRSYRTRFNNGSVVIKLCVGGTSALLVGDAEAEVERGLVGVFDGFLHSKVLKAGHHGSNTSSSAGFLKVVDPQLVVISVGTGNKFGHPSSDVLKRMSMAGMQVWRTDSLGAAYLLLSESGAKFVRWR